MADLVITDKTGQAQIHEPDEIVGYLYVDDKYIGVIATFDDSNVRITSLFHSIMLGGVYGKTE